jgi:hypothetical protein
MLRIPHKPQWLALKKFGKVISAELGSNLTGKNFKNNFLKRPFCKRSSFET